MATLYLDIKTATFGFLAIVGLPVLITVIAIYFSKKGSDLTILRNAFLICFALWSVGVLFSWKNYIKFDSNTLKVKAGFHSTEIKITDKKKLKVIQISETDKKEFGLNYKSLGTSFPRYHMGGFVLNNGLKAFVLIIGDASNRVLITYEDQTIITNIPYEEIVNTIK
ncbi:MAG: hypothetical protein ACI9LM_002239 [Alteromonadaceae bacterium]|jgi:hypothetical protein